jgi:hypothetical protein
MKGGAACAGAAHALHQQLTELWRSQIWRGQFFFFYRSVDVLFSLNLIYCMTGMFGVFVVVEEQLPKTESWKMIIPNLEYNGLADLAAAHESKVKLVFTSA